MRFSEKSRRAATSYMYGSVTCHVFRVSSLCPQGQKRSLACETRCIPIVTLLHRSQNRWACHGPSLSCLPLNSAFFQKIPQLPAHKAHALETVARLSSTQLVLLSGEIRVNKSCFNLDPIILHDKGWELVHHWCNVFSCLPCQGNGDLNQWHIAIVAMSPTEIWLSDPAEGAEPS